MGAGDGAAARIGGRPDVRLDRGGLQPLCPRALNPRLPPQVRSLPTQQPERVYKLVIESQLFHKIVNFVVLFLIEILS